MDASPQKTKTKAAIWRSITIGDVIIIIIALLASYYSFRHFQSLGKDKRVYIYKENLLWGEYPLDQERIIIIDEHNTVEISQGKVRMKTADCPDKRCVKMGFMESLPIICLPNQVVVEIKSSPQEHKFILH